MSPVTSYELKPKGLLIENFNFVQATGELVRSNLIEWSRIAWASISLRVANSGTPTAGVSKITAMGFNEDREQMTPELDIITAITTTNTNGMSGTIGKSVTNSVVGGTINDGNINALNGYPFVRFTVEITTTGTGGIQTGSLWIFPVAIS